MTKILGWMCALLICAGCQTEPVMVASNCDEPGGCAPPAALKIDAVDILLVLDNSGSIIAEAERLQAELPRLLEAVTGGADGDTTFPPASSVHVAVTTTDMSIDEPNLPGCSEGPGQDGVFVKPGEVGLTCDVSYPGYLAFDGQPAPVSTASSVGCLPLVLPTPSDGNSFEPAGCGFEQPLEAALKAVWPADRPDVTFLTGGGHGRDENAGFLRDDSLLVVIVVSDEDDCSAADLSLFDHDLQNTSPLNLRCSEGSDKLHRVQRYVDGLKALRPRNGNVIFGLIAGVPPQWVSDEARSGYDLADTDDVARYYDDILPDDAMQEVPVSPGNAALAHLRGSCSDPDGERMLVTSATPPRRLLEVAKGFGTQSVIGSICSADYGATTGRLIRAIGERLGDPATED